MSITNRKLMICNEAIARGAYEAGVKVISSYPGTPSTEITEFAAKYDEMYTEWAPNEKVAVETAIGAAIAGVRSMACMKHVGVNVAADPLFTVAYTGINAGFVLVVADDPAMHSSQNEQDSRLYAMSAHIPMLEPSDSKEALEYIKCAFDLSEEYDTPVMLRLTTRVAHSQSIVNESPRTNIEDKPYKKDPNKYVMMPAMARKRHEYVELRENKLAAQVESSPLNVVEFRSTKIGIVCAGAVYQYAKEATDASIFKTGMINPLPIESIRKFSKKVDRLIVLEELEPYIEDKLRVAGIKCEGKSITGRQGELSVAIIKSKLNGIATIENEYVMPNRPPVMCAGCPHRGVFYILKKLNLIVSGDIGCYTLGAAPPLGALDLCVCMGASIGMAHGFDKAKAGSSKKMVSVIGDSTFVHSGITGVINAVYNRGNSTIIILDNSITGMTGHQENPATGVTLKGDKTHKLDLQALVLACGASSAVIVDAYDLVELEKSIREGISNECVSVIIAKRPCALLTKKYPLPYQISKEKCRKCKACLKIGCPALFNTGEIIISKEHCVGCGVCSKLCAFDAIHPVS
ncbi:MAG: indolepyruvate ferredoxin oxidoreductase subunit alpha [Christensenellaceae bacterium]|jgi:indolepyruvate ferredoxin oxidoreductase alpha subunit|nr:indolepyruvate ferredoxin oxidoreductase subunit alpha [Christensenellaceae bacterium]